MTRLGTLTVRPSVHATINHTDFLCFSSNNLSESLMEDSIPYLTIFFILMTIREMMLGFNAVKRTTMFLHFTCTKLSQHTLIRQTVNFFECCAWEWWQLIFEVTHAEGLHEYNFHCLCCMSFKVLNIYLDVFSSNIAVENIVESHVFITCLQWFQRVKEWLAVYGS